MRKDAVRFASSVARQRSSGSSHVFARPDAGDGGADVERPRRLEQRVDLRLVCQVGAGGLRASELPRQRLGAVAAGVVVEDELGALAGERAGACGPDSARGAGDEHALSPQTRLHP